MTFALPTTYKTNPDPEYILNKLRLKSLEAEKSLFEKYPKVAEFLKSRNIDLGKLRTQSAKVITTGALTGSLLFANPSISEELPVVASIVTNLTQDKIDNATLLNKEKFISALREILPENPRPLERSQEKALEQKILEATGISTKATLEGEHLNTTYGYIGLEQHLMRYPGDLVSYMAPGRGAWGYFASSKSTLASSDIEREKWYVVVQTLYLPDWNKRLTYLRDWYKYRKVMVVNTVNGNAVVGDIADSGPAAFTGKVLVFFVDDPENKVPLGLVDYNNVKDLGLEMVEA